MGDATSSVELEPLASLSIQKQSHAWPHKQAWTSCYGIVVANAHFALVALPIP
jgi:hypothetical protein